MWMTNMFTKKPEWIQCWREVVSKGEYYCKNHQKKIIKESSEDFMNQSTKSSYDLQPKSFLPTSNKLKDLLLKKGKWAEKNRRNYSTD